MIDRVKKAAERGAEVDPKVEELLDEIEAAEEREENWRKQAKEAADIYESAESESSPYNILYANTEVWVTSIYNRKPVPICKRRFDDKDPVGKTASDILERVLNFYTDDHDPNYATVDDIIAKDVLEGLVTGRGVSRVKFDADIVETDVSDEGSEEVTKESTLNYESVCCENIPYNRFLHSYAKKWAQVSWIAIEHFLDKEEAEKKFATEIPSYVAFSNAKEAMEDEVTAEQAESRSDGLELLRVYEVWDKATKSVFFIAYDYPELFRKIEDPLKLVGFFPCPKPLAFYTRISGQLPQLLYNSYKEQAEELYQVSTRIRKINTALKVRGFFDGSIEGLERLLSSPDNTLVKVENLDKLEGKGLDAVIWMMPLSELVGVLQQLYRQRQEIKNIIFEITGISDILRGDTAASETMGAQELKSQWGSIRIKKMQREVMRYARDLYKLIAEVAITSITDDKLKAITGLPIPTEREQQEAKAQLGMLQMQAQAMQMQMQSQGQPDQQAQQQIQQMGQELQQKMAQLTSIVSQPNWESYLALLRDDVVRTFKIDIETNSTLELEVSEEKQQTAEFMNALAQFMNGVSPMVQSGILPFEAAKATLMAIVRKYRFGEQVEEAFEQMQAPQPWGQEETQKEQQLQEMEMQSKQIDMQLQKAKADAEQAKLQLEVMAKTKEHQMKMESMQRKSDLDRIKHQDQMKMMALKSAVNSRGV